MSNLASDLVFKEMFGKKEKSFKLFRPVVRLPGVVHIIYVHYYSGLFF